MKCLNEGVTSQQTTSLSASKQKDRYFHSYYWKYTLLNSTVYIVNNFDMSLLNLFFLIKQSWFYKSVTMFLTSIVLLDFWFSHLPCTFVLPVAQMLLEKRHPAPLQAGSQWYYWTVWEGERSGFQRHFWGQKFNRCSKAEKSTAFCIIAISEINLKIS